MSSYTNIPTDDLAVVEEQIQQHIVSLSHLRAKRNLFFPVFRLPPETLASIFIHGARDYYEGESDGHSTPCIPTWVNVSYVCSHWRNIALDCPALWTYHFILLLRWSEELLLRSKQVPLKISCIYSSHPYKKHPWWLNLLDMLLKHSERIQEFCLNVPLSLLPPILLLCVPHLEKLEIKFPWDITTRTIAIIDGEKAPLHTLKLANCPLPWYSLNLSGLKILSLHHVESPSLPSMAKFLAVLSNMSNLTTMELVGILPSTRDFLSTGGLDRSLKINLPCLALLVVNAPLSTVISLLSCINVLRRMQLNLQPLFESGSSVNDYTLISSFLAQQYSIEESSPLIFRSLVLSTGHIPSLTFGLDPHFYSPFEHVGCNVPLKVALGELLDDDDEEVEIMQNDILCIIGNIVHSLPLMCVQSLHITQLHGVSPYFLWEILGQLDGLQSLKLSSGSMLALSLLFLTAHKPEENPGRDQDPEHVFIPALEELELEDVLFVSVEGSHMSRKLLFSTLSTRKGLQDQVTMIDCEFR